MAALEMDKRWVVERVKARVEELKANSGGKIWLIIGSVHDKRGKCTVASRHVTVVREFYTWGEVHDFSDVLQRGILIEYDSREDEYKIYVKTYFDIEDNADIIEQLEQIADKVVYEE